MKLLNDCREFASQLPLYVDGQAEGEVRQGVEGHLRSCRPCSLKLEQYLEMQNVLKHSYQEQRVSQDFVAQTRRRLEDTRSQEPQDGLREQEDPQDGPADVPVSALEGLQSRFGGAPWWILSIALHGLTILLIGLVTMAVRQNDIEGEVVVTTELAAPKDIQELEEKKPTELARSVLESTHETPATDPTSNEPDNIVVPPDILAKAELGDHFETINPDRPDTQSAFGNPDAHMFHSEQGNDEEEGGGGTNGLSLDEVIGIGGASGSPGTGGGWGGGHGTGIGVGKGSGRGSFGQRGGGGRKLMVKRHGGSKQTESSVDKGLEWLARKQDASGAWVCRNTEGTKDWDPGVTGLATLAFLGAGHTEKVGKYKENVRKAVQYIVSQQRADGAIGADPRYKDEGGGYGYHNAICGMALAEAFAMARVPETGAAAQKSITYGVEQHQQGQGSDRLGYRYLPKSAGDTSCSGWFVMQLKSAKVAGLQVDPAAFQGVMAFFAQCELKAQDVQKEDPGYDNGRYRFGYQPNTAIGATNTAIGVLAHLFTGTKPEDVQGAGMWLLKKHPPQWSPKLGPRAAGDSFPMYYTYYATLDMFQIGGDLWKQWNEGLKAMLVPNQRRDGDFDGSWDPLVQWEKCAGRAYTTALGVLSLEVYYRYLPMYK